VSEPVNLR